jgi:hypothetical protein
MQLKVGNLSFNVLESGSGEPALLFLHYWGGSARTWNALTSELSSHSDAPQQGYSIRDLALDANASLKPCISVGMFW